MNTFPGGPGVSPSNGFLPIRLRGLCDRDEHRGQATYGWGLTDLTYIYNLDSVHFVGRRLDDLFVHFTGYGVFNKGSNN